MSNYNQPTVNDKVISFFGFLCRVFMLFIIIAAIVFVLAKFAESAAVYNAKTTQNEK